MGTIIIVLIATGVIIGMAIEAYVQAGRDD